MKLAILIGVAKYTQPVPDLPACTSDVKLMAQLIGHTNNFPDVLEISTNTISSEVKTQLAQFVTKHKDQTIDELFFYYSGHGDLFKEDFYYLFSDYSDARRNQTSLTNEELDSMLRTLSPKLTIKVVDACHAGVAYVKESDALAKQLNTSKGRFTNCYFMFSSQSSQTSLQDDKLSDFTKSFVEACTTFTGHEIRYRDIVDHISDAFASNTEQTPTFVIQAPCVEIFSSINVSIRKLADGGGLAGGKAKLSTPSNGSTIAELILSKAKEFSTRDEAIGFLSGLNKHIRTARFELDLKDMYHLEAEIFDDYSAMPSLTAIGKWLAADKEDIFAKVITTYDDFTGTSGVTGFEVTAEVPYKAIKITASPAYDALPHAAAPIVFVLSKRECTLFFLFQTIKETDWGKLSSPKSGKWTIMPVHMKNDPTGEKTADAITRRFESFVLKVAQEKLGLKTEQSESSKAESGTTTTEPKEK